MLGGLVLCVGVLTAQVVHGTGALVLEFGRAVRDFVQVVLDVMVVLICRGGEVVQTGLGLWAHVLQWVRSNGFLVTLIGMIVGLSYAWWAARASGLVVPQAVLAPTRGTGRRGRRSLHRAIPPVERAPQTRSPHH